MTHSASTEYRVYTIPVTLERYSNVDYQLQTSAGVDHWTGLERHWTNANSASRGGENLLQSSATGETKNVNHLSMNDGEEFVKLLIDTGG